MIRHIIAAIATALALWAVFFMLGLDSEADRMGQIRNVIARSEVTVKVQQVTPAAEPIAAPAETKKQEDEAAKKLKALRERAGNVMAFKVSPLYKQKCASCHGVNGEGIIGPKLVGKTSAEVAQALHDFKSGKRKNYVMYGLLSKLDEAQMQALSDEIGTFAAKAAAE